MYHYVGDLSLIKHNYLLQLKTPVTGISFKFPLQYLLTDLLSLVPFFGVYEYDFNLNKEQD